MTSSEIPKIDIPQHHQEFCKAVARLCREHKVSNFTGRYRPGYNDPWRSEIVLVWNEGRHGEDEDTVIITSQVDVRTKIEDAIK